MLPFNVVIWGIFLITTIKSWIGVIDIRHDIRRKRDSIERQQAYEKAAKASAIKLKKQFPSLSAYGLFLKYYLDARIQKVADALVQLKPEHGRDELIQKFYTLFDMDTGAEYDYDSRFIGCMDGYFVAVFQNP